MESLKADAFVCPIDPTLDVRSGLAKILSDAAGGFPKERSPIHEPFGKVVVMPAGKLRAKYVFFTVLLGERGEEKIKFAIRQSIDRAIRYAEFLRLKSLAFPLMGSTLDLPPYEFVAKQMLENTAQYMQRRKTQLKQVYFSIHNQEAFHAFRKEARSLTII